MLFNFFCFPKTLFLEEIPEILIFLEKNQNLGKEKTFLNLSILIIFVFLKNSIFLFSKFIQYYQKSNLNSKLDFLMQLERQKL